MIKHMKIIDECRKKISKMSFKRRCTHSKLYQVKPKYNNHHNNIMGSKSN